MNNRQLSWTRKYYNNHFIIASRAYFQHRHDWDDSPFNNQQRDLDTHVGSHMFHDDLIGWTTMSRIQVIPYTIPFVNRYVTCPRFDCRYPNTSNLVTGKSLYSFCNAWSRDQLLSHIELIMMMHYRVGPEIPLRHTEWQIPVSIRANPDRKSVV